MEPNKNIQSEVKIKPRWVGIIVSLVYLLVSLYTFFATSILGIFALALGFPVDKVSSPQIVTILLPVIFCLLLSIFGLICSFGQETVFKKYVRIFLWVPLVVYLAIHFF